MIKNANEFIPDFYTVNCDSIWLQAKQIKNGNSSQEYFQNKSRDLNVVCGTLCCCDLIFFDRQYLNTVILKSKGLQICN